MPALISTFVAGLILTPLLYFMGRELRRIDSVVAALEAYEAAPEAAGFTRVWLFGWRYAIQRRALRAACNVLGDRFVTGFLRLAGAFFLVFLVVMWGFFFFFAYQILTL